MNRIVVSTLIAYYIFGLLCCASARAEAPYNIAWSRQIGTTTTDYSYGVAVDPTGNAYISGFTNGSLAGPNAGGADAFLTKYDVAGNLLWSRQIGTSDSDYSSGVALDAAGNAYIGGHTYGSLGGPSAGGADAFITKYDSAGNLVWSRQVGSNDTDGGAVAVDPAGNSYISGLTIGSLAAPINGFADAFLIKYDGAGNLLWSRQFGTAGYDVAPGVAVDAAGNAYVSGHTDGSLGGPNAGATDAFLSKYDAAGNLVWSRQIGTADIDDGYDVAVDPAGNVYTTGNTAGSLGGPSAGANDAFLTKYDGAGNLLWSRQLGTITQDFSYGVAVDAAGNAYISGQTTGDLGGPSAGADDAFLTKYDGAGNLLWTHQFGTTAEELGLGVSLDAQGNAYVSGFTFGSLGGPNAGGYDAFLVKFAVPEPSTFVLAALALFSLAACKRSRRLWS